MMNEICMSIRGVLYSQGKENHRQFARIIIRRQILAVFQRQLIFPGAQVERGWSGVLAG